MPTWKGLRQWFTRGAAHVLVKPETGILVVGEKADSVSGTPTKLNPGSNILSAYFRFSDRGSAVAKELRIVFGASDDTDAANKLAAAGARRLVELDGEAYFPFDDSEAVQRIDFASDVASETGATKVYFEYLLSS